MSRYYHIHFDSETGEDRTAWFETLEHAVRFIDRLDEREVPVGFPVGSETDCHICKWKV